MFAFLVNQLHFLPFLALGAPSATSTLKRPVGRVGAPVARSVTSASTFKRPKVPGTGTQSLNNTMLNSSTISSASGPTSAAPKRPKPAAWDYKGQLEVVTLFVKKV